MADRTKGNELKMELRAWNNWIEKINKRNGRETG